MLLALALGPRLDDRELELLSTLALRLRLDCRDCSEIEEQRDRERGVDCPASAMTDKVSAASDESTVPIPPPRKLLVSAGATIVLSFEYESLLLCSTQSGLAGRLAIADATLDDPAAGDVVAGCPLVSLRVFLPL